MTNIKFDQGDINKLSLKEISSLHKDIKEIGCRLILRGYIRCDNCLSTTPLDMYVYDGYLCCNCRYGESEYEKL